MMNLLDCHVWRALALLASNQIPGLFLLYDVEVMVVLVFAEGNGWLALEEPATLNFR